MAKQQKPNPAFAKAALKSNLPEVRTAVNRHTLGKIVGNFKRNFLQKDIHIVDGLPFNQYDTVRRMYFYTHGKFESGDIDDQGNPKYFYDLMTHRADQARKNIDLDTKDVFIQAEGAQTNYLKSWLLRKEFMGYAKTSKFGRKLNELGQDLAPWGTVVWKKVNDDEILHPVELINLINDPSVKYLKDSSLVVERHLMRPDEVKAMKNWDPVEVKKMLSARNTVAANSYMTIRGAKSAWTDSIDDVTPVHEVYEVWGWVPETVMPEHATGDSNNFRYVMGIVTGIDDTAKSQTLYIKETTEDQFPYTEVHMRRKKGRWLGFGYTEGLFTLTEKANELTNRFYQGLRIGAMHLYQTRNKGFIRNVLVDLEDGDIVETPNEINPIPTEIRAFNQYQAELDKIEQKADQFCNSYESVTGDTLPSGTPFRLGASQNASAVKFFDIIKEDVGLMVEYAFNEWVLPKFAKNLTKEHTLELIGDADDLQKFFDLTKRIKQYDALKSYILKNSDLPTQDELSTINTLLEDQHANMPKSVLVPDGFYEDQTYSLKVVITDENDASGPEMESMWSLAQTIAANPAALQDDRFMRLIGKLTEKSRAFSPLDLNLIKSTPTNPSLNPANQGGNGAANMAAQGAPAPGVLMPPQQQQPVPA